MMKRSHLPPHGLTGDSLRGWQRSRIVIRRLEPPKQGDRDRFYFLGSIRERSKPKRSISSPRPRLFSFNNPFGACPTCQGFGRSVGIDEDLVFPDKSLTIKRGGIHPFRGETFGSHLRVSCKREAPSAAGIPIDKPIHTLT